MPSWPAFCRSILKSKADKWIGKAFMPLTTHADSVAKCVIRGYWFDSLGCLYFEVKDLGGRSLYDKTKFIYVGIDLHKEQHTAVIMNCFNEKRGEITFQNKPSEFGKLITKSKKYYTDGKQIVFALENSYGYGRALAAWLIEREYLVKDENPALSYAYRKSVPQYKKNDSYDAQCVARVAINALHNLPNAMPEVRENRN